MTFYFSLPIPYEITDFAFAGDSATGHYNTRRALRNLSVSAVLSSKLL
jgi:hypothetical protein